MAKAIPLVAAVAGTALGGPLAGSLGFTSAFAGQAAGFVVSTAINQLGSRALAKKPKAQTFSQEANGRSLLIRSSIESHKIVYGRARVAGPVVFSATVENGLDNLGNNAAGANKFLHLVIPLAGHEIDAVESIYLDDKLVTLDGNGFVQTAPFLIPFRDGKSYARIKTFLGSPDQAASPELLSECFGAWTADHRLRGLPYIHARFEYNQDAFPNGIPNISAVVRGKKVYDPRTGLTQWSQNAALCIRDYLSADYGFECDASEINDTVLIAAANVCDESVNLRAGGTQARYTCDGVLDTAATPLDNLGQLVTSIAGAVTYVQGQFRVHPAAYDSPAGHIDADTLAGELNAPTVRTPRKELFNTVTGTYIDPDKSWQPTDFAPVSSATFRTQDNGERITKDIDLPFVTNAERAQRIGKILLEKARQGIVVEATLKHHGMNFSPMDVVTLDDPLAGWSAKPFRVLRWGGSITGPVTVTLQEESSSSYAWDGQTEYTAYDAAPDTNLPDAGTVLPPGIPTVQEALYETTDSSGVKAKALVTWAPSTDAFVSRYQFEYRLVGATAWSVLPPQETTGLEIFDIAPGRYEARVKAISTLGVSSPYATALPTEIYGLSARPADITGLSIQTVSSLAVLRWVQPGELDVRIGGQVLIRHSELTSGATWEGSYSISEPLPGNSNMALVPLKAGTYLVKAVDSSGLTSLNAATTTTKNASVLTFSNLSTIQEDPAYLGTFSDTVADTGTLKLSGVGLFDDIPDFDSLSSLDDFGGVASTGTYGFASGTNNGSIKRVRVETSLEVQAVNVNDLIDDRTDDIDTWADFDGAAGGAEVDCYVEARTTDTDPTGSPVWGPWQRVDAADFEAWGLQYRAVLTSSDPAFNIYVTKLRITVKEVT